MMCLLSLIAASRSLESPSESEIVASQLRRILASSTRNAGASSGCLRTSVALSPKYVVMRRASSSVLYSSISQRVTHLVASFRRFYSLYDITHGEWRFGLASAPQLRFDGANCNELSLTRKHDTRAITPRIREDCDHRDCHTKAKRRFDSSLSVTDNHRFSVAQEPRRVDGLALHGVLKWL